MNDVNKPNEIAKVPITPVMDTNGQTAREWIYFFNTIGGVTDRTQAADLSGIVQQINSLNNDNELSMAAITPYITPQAPEPLQTSDIAALYIIQKLQAKIEELEQWQLLTSS